MTDLSDRFIKKQDVIFDSATLHDDWVHGPQAASKPAAATRQETARQMEPALSTITPSLFCWRDPSSIAPREWLYGHHLIRKYVSATIAPGGVGKSTLTITDAVAMVTGKALLGVKPHAKLRVWLWNGEDPQDELERRIGAVMLRYGVAPSEVEGRLWVDSGRDTPIRISDGPAGIAMPVIAALKAAINKRRIDALIIDPFVSVHSLPENDNGAMDAAVKAFALVADHTGCAIDLVHHSRKLNGTDADIDSARGGSAIAGAVRSARVLNVLRKEVAEGFGIEERDRRSLVRVDDAKANLAPPEAANYFKLTSVALGNATSDRPEDFVAVAESWTPPDAFDGITVSDLQRVQREVDGKKYRENVRATDWVGHAIGRVLDIDTEAAAGKKRVGNLIKAWLASGVLVVETTHDERAGRDTKIIDVGEWASE